MKRMISTALAALTTMTIMAQQPIKIKQTAGREQLGEFAPTFAHLNDDVLFGEVWSRNDKLSLRDRSLVTVVSLMSQGLTDSSLKYHLMEAKKNGITREEIAEIITHAAFYAGWPKAWATFRLAKEVWTEEAADLTKEEFAKSTLWPIGEPNTAYAIYFIGQSYLAPMDLEHGGPVNVTFEPRCRNNWHIHHKQMQVLVCVSGRGWYQEEGKEPVPMTPGTVIVIPAEVKHWHGAAKDSWFQHLTYHTHVEEGATNEWLEAVSDEVYERVE